MSILWLALLSSYENLTRYHVAEVYKGHFMEGPECQTKEFKQGKSTYKYFAGILPQEQCKRSTGRGTGGV